MGNERDFATSYDAGEGWDGDSAGTATEIPRASDIATGKASTTTTTTTVETPPVRQTPDDDRIPDDDDDPDPGDTDDTEDGDEPEGTTTDDRVPDDETDEERQAREDADKKPKKRRSWKEEVRHRSEVRFRLSEERRLEEAARAKTREERQKLERELEDLRRQRAAAPTPTTPDATAAAAKADDIGEEPTWEKWVDQDGKSPDEFHRAHSAWMRKSIAAERDAKLAAAIDEAKAAGKAEAARELEVQRTQEREAAIEQDFITRRDDFFAKNPGIQELADKTIGDLKSEYLSMIITRHPAGMELYGYLANHPRQAQYFAEKIEPLLTQPFVTAIRRAESPVPLVSHLVQNPAEVRRIASLPPADALMALGTLVATLRPAGVTAPASQRPSAPVTNAAPPLRPVAGVRSGGDRKPDDKHPDQWTPADLERMRKDRQKVARR
jgi:hypothetical protein